MTQRPDKYYRALHRIFRSCATARIAQNALRGNNDPYQDHMNTIQIFVSGGLLWLN
jgi:hypothetical protein